MSILISCSPSSSCCCMSTNFTRLASSRTNLTRLTDSRIVSASLFARNSSSTAFPALLLNSQSRFQLPPPSSYTSDSGVRAKASSQQSSGELRTCRICKQPFDASQNNPRACRFHTAHFGGETKRKFESVYSGGTMDTVGGGEIIQYWHCCGSQDPLHAGCEAAPHSTYDD